MRAEVLGDVHRAGRGRAGNGDDLLDGIAPTQLEPPGASPQIGQARRQVGPPGKPCRPAQRGVEHEERNDAMAQSAL